MKRSYSVENKAANDGCEIIHESGFYLETMLICSVIVSVSLPARCSLTTPMTRYDAAITTLPLPNYAETRSLASLIRLVRDACYSIVQSLLSNYAAFTVSPKLFITNFIIGAVSVESCSNQTEELAGSWPELAEEQVKVPFGGACESLGH